MIKIITAIGNEELNNILKKQNNIIIENPDIQYQEGIIEALEKYPDTNIIILSEKIIGNLKIEELIQNIIIIKNDIKIILLCNEAIYEEDENLIKVIKYGEDYLNIILKIFSDKKEIKNKINISNNKFKKIENKNYQTEIKNEEKNINKKIENKNLEKEIEKNFDEEKIKKEIQELKNYKNNLIEKNNIKKNKFKNKFNKNNILKKIKERIKNIKERIIKKKKYIITIIGCSGVRKNNFYFYIS